MLLPPPSPLFSPSLGLSHPCPRGHAHAHAGPRLEPSRAHHPRQVTGTNRQYHLHQQLPALIGWLADSRSTQSKDPIGKSIQPGFASSLYVNLESARMHLPIPCLLHVCCCLCESHTPSFILLLIFLVPGSTHTCVCPLTCSFPHRFLLSLSLPPLFPFHPLYSFLFISWLSHLSSSSPLSSSSLSFSPPTSFFPPLFVPLRVLHSPPPPPLFPGRPPGMTPTRPHGGGHPPRTPPTCPSRLLTWHPRRWRLPT